MYVLCLQRPCPMIAFPTSRKTLNKLKKTTRWHYSLSCPLTFLMLVFRNQSLLQTARLFIYIGTRKKCHSFLPQLYSNIFERTYGWCTGRSRWPSTSSIKASYGADHTGKHERPGKMLFLKYEDIKKDIKLVNKLHNFSVICVK